MLRQWLSCLSLVLLGLAGCTQPSASPSQSSQTAIPAGEIASSFPDFSARDLDGHEISSADLRGKVVLIDMWATWCQPCAKEMPGYQKLADRYGKLGFVVIGLKASVMKDTEDPRLFAKKLGVRYRLVPMSDELAQKFGGLEGLPTTRLYDRQGILRKKMIGFEYTDAFEDALKPLL